jgi:hypothetical protein
MGLEPLYGAQPGTGYMGLSAAASDAVTGGWGGAPAWGSPMGLGGTTDLGNGAGWGTGLYSSPSQSVWGGAALQPSPGAGGWSANGAQLAPATGGLSPWAIPGADPWSGLSPSGMQPSAQGLAMPDLSAGGAAGWMGAPAQATPSAAGAWGDAGMSWTTAPSAPAAGFNGAQGGWTATAPGAFAQGAGSLTLSPNPWLAVAPQGMGTLSAGGLTQGTPGVDLSPSPNPWLSAGPAASGLVAQPFSGAATQPLATQGITPGFGQPTFGGQLPATQGAVGAPGVTWQTQPQSPTGPSAWSTGGNPVITVDGQSWQVVAPNTLPDGTPANMQSLLDQARQAGFQLTPVQPQPGGTQPNTGLEAPVMPGQ